MASVYRSPYRVEVSWTSATLGLFTIGTSLIGSTDTLGSAPYLEFFGGEYDDVSDDVARATFSRGRGDTLTEMDAGEASVFLRDPTGFYSPQNPASPLATTIDDRLHPARISAKTPPPLPYFTPLFYGYVKRIVWEPQGKRGVTQLELVDFFYWLARVFPVIASTGPTTTGGAIGLILDAAGWPTASSLRNLDVGDSIPDFSATGAASGLDLIAGLLEAERGVFFIGPDGIPNYESRHARTLRTTPSRTITNVMTRVAPSADLGLIRNRVRVKRTQTSYVATASDVASSRKVGWSDLAQIDTPYLSADSQADALAAWLLSQVKQPRSPVRGLTIDNREQALYEAMIFANLVDRWTVQEAKGGTGGDYYVERLAHSIDFTAKGRHTLELLLSEASGVQAFQIGVSRLAAVLTNLLTNPSLETDLTNWFVTNSVNSRLVGTIEDHVAWSGEFFGRCYAIGLPAAYSTASLLALIGATAGRIFTFAPYVWVPVSSAGKNLNVYLLEAGGASGSDWTMTSYALVAGWQRLTVTRTIAQNDRTSLYGLIERSVAIDAGEYFDWDAAQLEELAVASAYFDGSSPGAAWTGTPHASTSTKIVGGDVLVY